MASPFLEGTLKFLMRKMSQMRTKDTIRKSMEFLQKAVFTGMYVMKKGRLKKSSPIWTETRVWIKYVLPSWTMI